MYIKKYKYNNKSITPQTRLIDLVEKKYHTHLRKMISELCLIAKFDGETEWWRVRKIVFNNPRTQLNYAPLATFINKVANKNCYGLKCSIDTFFRYITSSNHSNLSAKWKSVKTLTYSILRYRIDNEKR